MYGTGVSVGDVPADLVCGWPSPFASSCPWSFCRTSLQTNDCWQKGIFFRWPVSMEQSRKASYSSKIIVDETVIATKYIMTQRTCVMPSAQQPFDHRPVLVPWWQCATPSHHTGYQLEAPEQRHCTLDTRPPSLRISIQSRICGMDWPWKYPGDTPSPSANWPSHYLPPGIASSVGSKEFRFWRKTDEMTKTGRRDEILILTKFDEILELWQNFWRNLHFLTNVQYGTANPKNAEITKWFQTWLYKCPYEVKMETSISRSSVRRIAKHDLRLKIYKRYCQGLLSFATLYFLKLFQVDCNLMLRMK